MFRSYHTPLGPTCLLLNLTLLFCTDFQPTPNELSHPHFLHPYWAILLAPRGWKFYVPQVTSCVCHPATQPWTGVCPGTGGDHEGQAGFYWVSSFHVIETCVLSESAPKGFVLPSCSPCSHNLRGPVGKLTRRLFFFLKKNMAFLPRGRSVSKAI